MKIIISNIIEIEEPTKEILDYCKRVLTIKNPDYTKKVQMGFWTQGTPKEIRLYNKVNNKVWLPIGCFNDIFKMYPTTKIYTDYSVKVPANIESHITLRDYQKPCLNALENNVNGVLLLDCGMGKTECALACAAHLKQKTLFVAHTKDLVNQAKERCEQHLSCKTSMIADGKVDLSGDIVFATVQTLFKKLDDIPQETFGLLVCDECHHIGANAESVGMFRTVMDHFAARYKLGLTATLHRADGLEVCIPKMLGGVIYEIKQDGNEYVGIYDNKEVIRFPINEFRVPAKINIIETNYRLYDAETDTYRDVFDRSGMTISFAKLISDIGSDKSRNKLIIDLCNGMKGSTIILSDRIEQLKYLSEHIKDSVQIDGSTKKQLREKAFEDIKSGKKRVLLASYQLAKEGLDCKILQNVVFATPVKDEAIVIQCVGRAQRTYEGKKIANIYDLVDDVSMLTRFFQKRRSVYRKKGWWN